MSSQLKERVEDKVEKNIYSSSKVNLNDLVNRLNVEKKKERNNNIILSVAAVSVVTVFGIILAL